jgi:predicted transcriptional regulator with HTH domain
VKLSAQQRWALAQIATGGPNVCTAGVAEMHVRPATYRGLMRLGLIVERTERGVRRVSLTDAGRSLTARAA